MIPYRVQAPYDWQSLLALIQTAFAHMDGRIDPPSSMHALTEADLARQSTKAEIWAISPDPKAPPVACVVLTPKAHALYVGKLAVAKTHRGQGLARRLITLAETRARALGLPALELQVRVELAENHATFRALGFRKTAETAHPGYTRPTSCTFTEDLPPIRPKGPS